MSRPLPSDATAVLFVGAAGCAGCPFHDDRPCPGALGLGALGTAELRLPHLTDCGDPAAAWTPAERDAVFAGLVPWIVRPAPTLTADSLTGETDDE